jgi:DNA polymerase III sliding clamp (beta) subunit (PCNA family)
MEIKTNELQAVSYAMAKGDIRYYLNGMLLETDGAGNHRLVATDGHRVHIVDNGLTKAEKTHIIPREAVEQALKIKLSFVAFEALSETEGILKHAAGGIQFKFVEAKYPDYRRVLPEALDEIKAGKYDIDFLSDALKAMQAYRGGKKGVMLDFVQQGEGLGVAVYDNLFVGIMACRANMNEAKTEAGAMLTRLRGNV